MATEITLPSFDTLTSKPYTIPSDGLTFLIKNKGTGTNNSYFGIMFGSAIATKIAFGENPEDDDFFDVSNQFALESLSSGILNSGTVRITIKGTGKIHIVSK